MGDNALSFDNPVFLNLLLPTLLGALSLVFLIVALFKKGAKWEAMALGFGLGALYFSTNFLIDRYVFKAVGWGTKTLVVASPFIIGTIVVTILAATKKGVFKHLAWPMIACSALFIVRFLLQMIYGL